MDQPKLPPATENWQRQTRRMLDSYRQLLGAPLLPDVAVAESDPDGDVAQRLFKIPAVVLAHDGSADPIFCYANRAALKLFEVTLAQLLTMPSRLSAEPTERNERSKMLNQGLKKGYITNYEGIRVSSSGKRFYVRNATIWNVMDEEGVRVGQAATFSDWEYLA